ncbi:hypothetical protein PKB_2316 [Pseudomonas knackmussii B13]|uniref:Uncharacterized protein n=1 Tax=Pseudomonas knackmussii (strain DSM 6978 / CCUG 54928 / LMG 23759 / B13) TaxID=1301098 RepID=A0A024HGU7_PSEKB|nr:hypothetical protein PKB_2316 [Pseudomonas knackmussii B13]
MAAIARMARSYRGIGAGIFADKVRLYGVRVGTCRGVEGQDPLLQARR